MPNKERSSPSVVKVPVFNFPTKCWKCGRSISVLFPANGEVARVLHGSLKHVGGEWVNVCPYCGAPYDNRYLMGLFVDHYARKNIRKYCVGFITWELRCVECREPLLLKDLVLKDLEENPFATDEDYVNAVTVYLNSDHLLCEECAQRVLKRIP